MSIFDFFRAPKRPSAAAQAKERLQIVLAHQRADRDTPDFLPALQADVLAAIKKYIAIDDDKVALRIDRSGGCSLLEVNIELPAKAVAPQRMAG